MKKEEVIEKLREYGAWCTECHDIHGKKDIYVKAAKVRELIEQLDEPQDEKVEVPDFVAEWFESRYHINQDIYNLLFKGNMLNDNSLTKFEKWFYSDPINNFETLIRMKDGYTVKYIPPFVDEFRYYSVDDEIFDITESSWTSDKEDAYPFTEKEKAEALAFLVDGSVEEV